MAWQFILYANNAGRFLVFQIMDSREGRKEGGEDVLYEVLIGAERGGKLHWGIAGPQTTRADRK